MANSIKNPKGCNGTENGPLDDTRRASGGLHQHHPHSTTPTYCFLFCCCCSSHATLAQNHPPAYSDPSFDHTERTNERRQASNQPSRQAEQRRMHKNITGGDYLINLKFNYITTARVICSPSSPGGGRRRHQEQFPEEKSFYFPSLAIKFQFNSFRGAPSFHRQHHQHVTITI